MAAYRDKCIIEDSSDSDIEVSVHRKGGVKNNVIDDSSSEDDFRNISPISATDNAQDSSDSEVDTRGKKNDFTNHVIDDTSVSLLDSQSDNEDNVEVSQDLEIEVGDSKSSFRNAIICESSSEGGNTSSNSDFIPDSCDESSPKANNSTKGGSVKNVCNKSPSTLNNSVESECVKDPWDESQGNLTNPVVNNSVRSDSEGEQELYNGFQDKRNVRKALQASPERAQGTLGKGSYHEEHDDKENPRKEQNERESIVVLPEPQERVSFVEVSSDEDEPKVMFAKPIPVKQEKKSQDIRTFLLEEKLSTLSIKPAPDQGEIRRRLRSEIDSLEKDISKLRNTMINIDMSKLPDNGLKLKLKFQETHSLLKQKIKEFSELPPSCKEEAGEGKENQLPPVVQRLPLGFGAKALETQVREKTLTEEALHALHGSINSCPGENVMAEDPAGLKSSVSLMPHQKHAIAWMLWRESQKPKAGILADDMGLGKTLTSISLVLKDMEEEEKKNDRCHVKDAVDDDEDDDEGFPKGGTLVVCPASLMHQWEDEIKKYCKRGVLEVEIHHGNRREDNSRTLARNDIVLTTYSIVRTSANKGGKDENVTRKRRGVLHRIKWKRIILDEAHVVRNHKSQQSIAVCLLMGARRWALTGTPIHNKELDLYALLKFLRVSPFDDYNVWKRWVDSKSSAGIKRLNTVINAIMLRRTKSILQGEGVERKLPAKLMSEIEVKLAEAEYDVYTKVLLFSKTLFAQFLQQRADKENVMLGGICCKPSSSTNSLVGEDPFKSYPQLGKMFQKMTRMRDIKTHQILVLLLRLRQICCHPCLIKAMVDQDSKEIGGIEDENGEDIDLLSQMNQMSLKESAGEEPQNDEDDEDGVLNMRNPIFNVNRASSKIDAVLSVIDDKIVNSSDKGIVVSQWSSMLDIIHTHLRKRGIKCDKLTGAVPVKDRMDVVRRFNNESSPVQILLLSLTAGGVGLNLTGANHLFLVDLHWNPQLESQAFDRIYRVGQKKEVFIYKFFCKETIEERIKILQSKKLSLANDVLQGSMKRNINKLTLDDLKSLFSM